MSHKYNWTVTSKYYYDQTLTTDLIKKQLADDLDSSGRDTQMYPLAGMGNLYHWPADREKRHDTSYHYEEETEEPLDPAPTNSTYHCYENFTLATGINFADLRSSAAAAGLTSHGYIPNGLSLADNTSAGNITFDTDGEIEFAGSNTLANDITFTDGGYVYFQPGPGAGSGNQTLTGLLASKDLDEIAIDRVARGGSVTIDGGQVRRNLRHLKLGEEPNGWTPVSSQTGSGILVDGLVVRGVLNSVYVASGASVNHLTVGLDRQWSGSDVSAFLNESNGVLVPNFWGSHTNMTIESGGTATNITLGNGGRVYVSGPSDTVTSEWVVTATSGGSMVGDGYWKYTTHYASGTGGILKDLNMASSGGLQFDGVNDPRATWVYPSNGYLNVSRTYESGFLATAPQSSYVWFGSNTSGSNINIGNGGSLYIGKDAHVSAISMGGLTTSTFFKNSSGTTDTWIGDRGANLQIYGGKVSGVVMDPVLETFDYYSAAHDYFWLHSETIKNAYSSAHGSYGSGEAWSSAMYASASATYRQYMSAMYTSGAVYTNLGDDTAYNRRYVGGNIGVHGGWIMNVSGFSYLGVTADVDVEVKNNVSSWKTYQYTDGNVSKAIGAVSATLDVTGGAHVYNVKIEGGRVIMTGGGEVNARWHSRENKQSNYNLVEDLDLRIGDVVGLGSAYPAVIEFHGGGSGGYSKLVSSGGTSGYVDYTWDAIDPGEIHSVTASKGLVVSANWTTHQDFTYIGSGAVTINGLGTVVLKDNHSRYTSDSYYGKGPYLGSAFDTYYFGVVKGVYNEEDGVLENRTILDGTDGAFDWTGFLMVGSGGIIQNIGSAAPLKTGNNIVNSDTWTPEYDRDACKVLTVVAGGSADNVTVKGAVSNFEHFESQYTESRAGLLVSSGGTATNVTVLEGGIAMAEGGTIDKVFVAGGGTLYLSGWAGAHQVGEVDSDYNVTLSGPQYLDTTVLNGVRLDSGGQLTNTLDWGFRKGHAPSVIANKGGGIMNGVTANGVAYVSGLDYAGAITLTKDQQAIDVTVRGYKDITSRDSAGNPTAYNTVIASLNVSSGGIVKGATVGDEGAIYVSEGANVSGLSASGGRIIFENAGSGWGNYFPASATVTGITVEAGGVLEVNSKFGLTASNVQIGQDAGLTFTLGDTASDDYTPTELNGTWTADWGNGTFYTADGVLSGFGGQFGHEYKDLFYSSSYMSAPLTMTIIKGGVLSGADLRGCGNIRVTSGGKIMNTKIKGVGVGINAGGYASALSATTDPDRTANQTQFWAYGSGATLDDTVLNGGLLGLEVGAVANGVTMTAPEGYTGGPGDAKTYGPAELDIMPGGTANDVVASAGIITLDGGSSKEPGTAGATLNNADVHSSASIIVMTDDAVMTGKLNLAGRVITTTKRTEYVPVEVDDVDNEGNPIHYTDYQPVQRDNATVDASKLTVNFDLTERNGLEEEVMIDNLANLQGATLATISISGDQPNGQYVLAKGAGDFKGTLTVNSDGKKLGDFTVGTILQVSADEVYSLTNNDSVGLVFNIQNTQAAVESIIATVGGKEMLAGQWSNKGITIKTKVNGYAKSIWYKIRKAALSGNAAGALDPMWGSAAGPADEGWTQLDNDKGITITEYCDVQFMALNEKGAQSRVVTYTVNYDAQAAVVSDFRSDAGGIALTTGMESQVSVTVTDDHDLTPKLELKNKAGEWIEVERGANGRYSFTVTGNGDYQLRTTDHADNVGTQTVTVDFYDLQPGVPAKPTASANITALTNKDVTVSATFSNDTTQKQYSLDNKTWQAYTSGVVLTANGTVYFRGGNDYGFSQTVSYTVSNIDKVAPNAPEARPSTTAPTNQNVTVNAVFSNDSAQKQYSLDSKTWKAYTSGVVLTANGTVSFRGIDAAGNISKVTSVTVSNIDKVPPAAPTASASTTAPTRDAVTVSANFSGDSAQKQYSLDNKTWQAYTSGVVLTANGTVSFRGIDAAGNISPVATYTVSNIVSDDYKISGESTSEVTIPLNNSGRYILAGDFGDITGTVTVLNGGKKVGTGTLKNGELTFNKGQSVLLDKALETVVQVTVKSGENTRYNAMLNAEQVFPGNNADDAPEGARDLGVVIIVPAPMADDWVGFGDEFDYRRFSLASGAKLSFTVSASDAVKFTVYDPATGKALQNVSVKAGDTAVTKSLLVNAGTYFFSVQSSNAKKGGSAYYSVTLNEQTVFFTKGNNNDDTPATAVALGPITAAPAELVNDWVGLGDEFDFRSFSLTSGARVSFTVGASDAVKFTLYDANTGKALQNVSVKANQSVNTKDLLLNAGNYYFSVQSTNAKKGGAADYSVALNDRTVFYTKGNNSDDTPATAIALGPVTTAPAQLVTDWVGLGDEFDFRSFSLASGARLSFTVSSSDAVKFTVYDANTGKALQNVSVKAGQTVNTKDLLLNAGNYYFSVQSTNAKKGGAADYTVALNDRTFFYIYGNNADDTPATATALGTLTTAPAPLALDWVGLGDEIDFRSFSLETGAKLSFTIGASDAVKFTLYDAATGKALQNVSVKANQLAETKELQLNAGNYYFSVQSTNAKKGGSAEYVLGLNEKARFYPAGDHTNDTWQDAAAKPAKLAGDVIEGWVGFGDPTDFIKFQLAEDGQIQLTLDDGTVNAFNGKQIKLSCLDAEGKSVAVALDGNLLVSKKDVLAGEYYLGVTCANVKKFDSNYNITVGGMLA